MKNRKTKKQKQMLNEVNKELVKTSLEKYRNI